MNVESVLNLSEKFCYWAEQPLDKIAAAKKKKVDPKAKVRNRGTVCVPAASAKDKKDHFPINNEAQARNALARVHQYSTVPSWYKGSLKGLQALVARKVKAKYPKIDVGGKKTKKSDLEIGLQKQGALKEHIDRDFNHLMKEAMVLGGMSRVLLQKLEKVKLTYTVEFDPELENTIVENMPRMKEVASRSIAYANDLSKKIDELLKRIESASTKSSKGPISAPNV